MPTEKFEQILPSSWDGRFPFTNDSDEDFVFAWGKKDYHFPARRTVDMMRMNFNATPVEIQQIRKFAAKKWAEREFFKSPKYEAMRATEGKKNEVGVIVPTLMNFQSARSYDDNELKDDILRCLTPLPEGQATISATQTRDIEAEIHKDAESGKPVSEPIKNTTQSINDKAGFVLVN